MQPPEHQPGPWRKNAARRLWPALAGGSLLAAAWIGLGFSGAWPVFLGCIMAWLFLALPEGLESSRDKHTGVTLELPGLGPVQLNRVLVTNTGTEIYFTNRPGVIVKIFDLNCPKADEISYGPYMSFSLELGNFEEIRRIPELQPWVPAYYGADIDYGKRYAYLAMEYFEGRDLKSWCEEASASGYPNEWLEDFREAVYEALGIVQSFHRHGIVLVDFKPDNIIRLHDRNIKFVDLGALFTPRHLREMDKFVYSATPDHAEVLIDASNIQTGVAPAVATDVFSAGVALFELATGATRLSIEAQTADDILNNPSIFLFRDSQIKDIWRLYPNLREVLPLVETQLKERQILFADLWPLLKGYVACKLSDWETLLEEQKDQILMATGTTFIMEQLPPRLQWLAGSIAQATVLRNLRCARVSDLLKLLGKPISEAVHEDLSRHSGLLQGLRDLELPADFVSQLNTWEVRLNPQDGHWAIATPLACRQLADNAVFTFLRLAHHDESGHRFYQIVGDLEADDVAGQKLALCQLQGDHFAWLGASPGG